MICMNMLLILYSLYWFYLYNFTSGLLFLFKYPNWVLLMNALLGVAGIFISILLYNEKIGIKLFSILTFAIWLVSFSNYIYPIY